jgi:hypothetical protein
LQPGFDVFSLFFTDVRGYKAAVGVALKKNNFNYTKYRINKYGI